MQGHFVISVLIPHTACSKPADGVSMLVCCNLQAAERVGIRAVLQLNKMDIPVLSWNVFRVETGGSTRDWAY